MPQLDFSTFLPQIFWLLFSLSILYLILSRYALPRISDVIEERKDIIAHDIDKAKEYSADTDKAIEDLNLKITEARSESQQMINNSILEIKNSNELKKNKLFEDIKSDVSAAEKVIYENKDLALKDIANVCKDLSFEMLDNLSIDKIDKKKISNLSDNIN
ncbi:MAG: hypothetical protein VX575_00010 [Pseudomonadota bacterium]|nr:hypothetical protein [Pseudomonadota bacterium]MEC9459170.1 hypothetical protein [Pseudomonadota bacterium]